MISCNVKCKIFQCTFCFAPHTPNKIMLILANIKSEGCPPIFGVSELSEAPKSNKRWPVRKTIAAILILQLKIEKM